MTQTLPLSIVLGSANAGKIIGYTVLNLDRTEYAALALATESDVPGTYYALGGYAAPDAGGYVVVSESDGLLPATWTALAETDIESSAVNVTQVKGTALTETSTGRLAAALIKLLDVASPVLTAASVNQSGDAFARLGAPTGASVSADVAAVKSDTALILEDTGTSLPAMLATINSNVLTRTSLGAGAITYTYTLTSEVDGSPIADADVWVTSDAAASSLLASGRTNASGQVTFYLDVGTVYVWRQKSGWNFYNPDTETVS